MFIKIFYFTTYVFALYGFISLILKALIRFHYNVKLKDSNVRLVLIEKNQEEIIEGIVRNIFQRRILESITRNETLYILDMGSTDKTCEILHKLKETYSNMKILTIENGGEIFVGFSQDG